MNVRAVTNAVNKELEKMNELIEKRNKLKDALIDDAFNKNKMDVQAKRKIENEIFKIEKELEEMKDLEMSLQNFLVDNTLNKLKNENYR